MAIQFLPFFIWIFFNVELLRAVYICWMLILVGHVICQHFLLFSNLSLFLSMVSFYCAKASEFTIGPFVYFLLLFLTFLAQEMKPKKYYRL